MIGTTKWTLRLTKQLPPGAGFGRRYVEPLCRFAFLNENGKFSTQTTEVRLFDRKKDAEAFCAGNRRWLKDYVEVVKVKARITKEIAI